MAFLTSSQTVTIINPNNPRFLNCPSLRKNGEFRLWKRRRLKRLKPKPKSRRLFLNNELEPSSSQSSFDLLSFLPANWIPPAALGFASALALSLPRRLGSRNSGSGSGSDSEKAILGEWVLFSSPTPFNRFVLLRCPSIAFECGEGVNEKLITEERHYVRLDSGRIKKRVEEREEDESLEYERVCVRTEDGGVISLDWPASLDLSEERGLDTTVLIVPGTAEGSMEENVREFVRECLRRGLFPVVMNPRGCANSPLTTPRLFTAADSDDFCSAVKFITRSRPWSTLTGVGWGYGANMLTKYLAEVGEKTPLTAATCIDNPFDLDEATKTSPSSVIIDKKLTGGLIDILKSNKELFQGRRKGFDVEKALAAESIRDFEKAISMVSYGFDRIEEFYANCSTRSMVGNLKIPVLFIQNDDGTVPLFSIPRGLIAENPFTSLLLSSCVPSNVTATTWYQQVTIEWLAAVELGLLKGRHPLLQDIDVTINPSKGLALLEGRTSDATNRRSVLNLTEVDSSDSYLDPMKEMLTDTDASASAHLKSNPISQRDQGPHDQALGEMNGGFQKSSSIDADTAQDTESNPVEGDTGQVRQTAEVVMNMLDVTMPGTLKEEDKTKVLAAVGRGETLIKALQDAVPEDVRGKLTTSVTEILQVQGKNLNLDKLLSIDQIANVSSDPKLDIKEKMTNQSDAKTENIDHTSDSKDSGNDGRNNDINNQTDVAELGGEGAGAQPPKSSLKSSDLLESEAVNSHSDDAEGSIDFQNSDDKLDSDASAKKVVQHSENAEDGSETTAKLSSSSSNAGDSNSVEAGVVQNNRSQNDETNQQDSKENNTSAGVGNPKDLSNEQSNTSPAADIRPAETNEALASSISEGQPSEKIDDDNRSKDEKVVQPLPDQSRASDAKSPSFGVTQALDALTGLDDSTQVAVNSVFGVIEDMITQLEEKRNENADNKGDNHEDASLLDIKSVNGDDTYNNVEATGKEKKMNLVVNKAGAETSDTPANINESPLNITTDPYAKAFYKEYLRKHILSKLQNVKSFDLDATTALFLHYIPEERHWILLEKPRGTHDSLSDNTKDGTDPVKLLGRESDIIEPSYVILDKERLEEPPEEVKSKEKVNEKLENHDNTFDKSKLFVKTSVIDSLKIEVGRRLSATDMKGMEAGLAADMEEVADAVYLAIRLDGQHVSFSGVDHEDQEGSSVTGKNIIEAIFKAVQNTSYLSRVLPVGVIVGSTLAALRSFFDAAGAPDSKAAKILDLDQEHINELKGQLLQKDVIQVPADRIDHDATPEKKPGRDGGSTTLNHLDEEDGEKAESQISNRDALMVGAVTAALGASALLTSQQGAFIGEASCESSSNSEEKYMTEESDKFEEVADSNHQSNIVSSFAEKAMSVAAPVVPTKGDGEVDHERIVGMLAELGQRGGMLRLVAKVALLWGGLRGAMSLTDRLISFFRVAERPLLQRVLGFTCMVLVLWSPVLVPLLPTLIQNMATHNTTKIAELACIFGLYTAVTILITQWGKRVRGYEHPLKQYGLDLMSSRKIQDLLTGLTGGVVLVLSIHSVNTLLGVVSISLPTNLSSSSLNLTAKLQAYGQLFLLVGRGLLMAAGVAFVEELLFRSWLLEEIAADLGYHAGIILSGLVFSLSQRSLLAVPGLWLLSMCLAGARFRKEGSLFIPIGLRTGIMTSSFVLQMGGFLTYQPKFQLWVAGTHPFQPFSGIVGLLFALSLAVALYPWQPSLRRRVPRPIRA